MRQKPRVLIVSNNPLSTTNNNGKTLQSFFKGWSKESLYQLYFSEEVPETDIAGSYFKLSDNDILRNYRFNNETSGEIKPISNVSIKEKTTFSSQKSDDWKKNDTLRLLREFLWIEKKWKTKELENWLEKVNPNVVFFVAGDSLFAYKIVNYICKKFNSKLAVYITDDYILPRSSSTVSFKLKQKLVFKKMKKIIFQSDLFYTISKEMKEKYLTIFKKDSQILINITPSMRNDTISKKDKDSYTLIYAGGLHLNRDKILIQLGQVLKKYNKNTEGKKANLIIFSNQIPNSDILSQMSIPGASEFGGSLNESELRTALNKADFPVHVESFDKTSKAATYLSVSTKIPEYLSLGKPIIAIGPKDIASMNYLKDVAYCVNNEDEIEKRIAVFLKKEHQRKLLGIEALKKYNQNHDSQKIRERLHQDLINSGDINYDR